MGSHFSNSNEYHNSSDTAQYAHFPYLDLLYDEEPLERKRIRRKKRWPIVVGIVVALLVACGASGAVLLR